MTVGRNAVVTGGGSGIGRAVVNRFMEAGWRVLVLDRCSRPEGLDGDVEYVQGDVASIDEVTPELREFAGGRMDALINNAAVQMVGPVLDVSTQDWQRTMDVNLIAAARITGACREWLVAARGSVINISSVHARATSPGLGAYAASKAALLSLTKSLALELGGFGVRVNAVLPGAVDTDMLRAGLARSGGSWEEGIEALGRRTALGRVGLPEDVAEAVLFFADGDRASFATGSCLVLDGGALARLSTE